MFGWRLALHHASGDRSGKCVSRMPELLFTVSELVGRCQPALAIFLSNYVSCFVYGSFVWDFLIKVTKILYNNVMSWQRNYWADTVKTIIIIMT